jgi:hypothetical protein
MLPSELFVWRDTSATLEFTPLQLAYLYLATQTLGTLFSSDDETRAFIDDILAILQEE